MNPRDSYAKYIHNFFEFRKALIGANAGAATLYVYFLSASKHVNNALLAISPMLIFFIGLLSAGFIIYANARVDSLNDRADSCAKSKSNKVKRQAMSLIARARKFPRLVKLARGISVLCFMGGTITAFYVVYQILSTPPPCVEVSPCEA